MRKAFDKIKEHYVEFVVILALILAGFLALLFTELFSPAGSTVSVTVNGEPFGEYSLYFDNVYQIGENNTLSVKDGSAYMSYAACPDKTCVNMGKISKVGERIICLPNRVTVEIK